MDLGISKKLRPLREKVSKMVIEEIAPIEHEYFAEVHKKISFAACWMKVTNVAIYLSLIHI